MRQAGFTADAALLSAKSYAQSSNTRTYAAAIQGDSLVPQIPRIVATFDNGQDFCIGIEDDERGISYFECT